MQHAGPPLADDEFLTTVDCHGHWRRKPGSGPARPPLVADGQQTFHQPRPHAPYIVMESLTAAPTVATSSGTAATRPLLVSAHEAARLLGIGRTTLYELIKLDVVTPVHIGRCVRFSLVELERYVEHLVSEASCPTTFADTDAPADTSTRPTLC